MLQLCKIVNFVTGRANSIIVGKATSQPLKSSLIAGSNKVASKSL
jgi:hypothetical protein